jgi:hypothetical protein
MTSRSDLLQPVSCAVCGADDADVVYDARYDPQDTTDLVATFRASGDELLIDREAILLTCDHPRTIEIAGDRPDHAIELAVDRATGVILRLVETIGGAVTRHAAVTELTPDASLPPSAFEFVFPTGTTMLY